MTIRRKHHALLTLALCITAMGAEAAKQKLRQIEDLKDDGAAAPGDPRRLSRRRRYLAGDPCKSEKKNEGFNPFCAEVLENDPCYGSGKKYGKKGSKKGPSASKKGKKSVDGCIQPDPCDGKGYKPWCPDPCQRDCSSGKKGHCGSGKKNSGGKKSTGGKKGESGKKRGCGNSKKGKKGEEGEQDVDCDEQELIPDEDIDLEGILEDHCYPSPAPEDEVKTGPPQPDIEMPPLTDTPSFSPTKAPSKGSNDEAEYYIVPTPTLNLMRGGNGR